MLYDIPQTAITPLVAETADRVVAGESDLSASLRFGHDTYAVSYTHLNTRPSTRAARCV